MDNPKCPICKSDMIKRQARKGPYAGSYFWSCVNFPKTGCKGLINIGDNEVKKPINQSKQNKADKADTINHIIPELLRAKPLYKGFDSIFVQSISIPMELLSLINNEVISADSVRDFSQWRMDFKINDTDYIEPIYSDIFTLILKILTRGTLTISSSNLESRVKELFKVKDFKVNLSSYLSHKKSDTAKKINFEESRNEQLFYYETLRKYIGKYYDFYTIPQVYLDSLTGEFKDTKLDAARVDFLISYNGKKFVVELDGEEHDSHSDYDKVRNELLALNGVEVIRIKNNEDPSTKLNPIRLLNIIEKFENQIIIQSSDKYMITMKLLHQIQIALTHAIIKGYKLQPNNIIQIKFSSDFIDKSIESELLKLLTLEFNTLLQNVEDLFDQEKGKYKFEFISFKDDLNDLFITFESDFKINRNIIVIKDFYYPGIISNQSIMSGIRHYKKLEDSTLEYFLDYLFRKPGFREGQIETIKRGLQGKDTLVLLPTGSGKSIAFQLTSLLLNGVTIVIDPIISLIQDQIENLNRVGIDRIAGISSLITDRDQK